ncbi:hypothetical protein KI387_003782, partial [Taxus chinensis]
YVAAEHSFPNQEMLQGNQFLQVQEEILRSMVLQDESSTSELLAIYKPQARNIDGVPLEKSDIQKRWMISSINADQSQELLEQQGLFNQLKPNYAKLPLSFSTYLEECYAASQTETDEDFVSKVEKVWSELNEEMMKDVDTRN